MPDNWTFVAAAYGLAAVVLGGYWVRLGRKERELAALAAGRAVDRRPPGSHGAVVQDRPRTEPGSRSPQP
jgi:hypothetical protein